jgi:hypothetical protein
VPFREVAVVVNEQPVVLRMALVVLGLLKCFMPTFEEEEGAHVPSSVEVVVSCYCFFRFID